MEQLPLFEIQKNNLKEALKLLAKKQKNNRVLRSKVKAKKEQHSWFRINDRERFKRREEIRVLHLLDNFLRKTPYRSVEKRTNRYERPFINVILSTALGLGIKIDSLEFREWYHA